MRLYFFKLDGLRGESYAPRHIGEMELSGFTWRYPHSVRAGAGNGAGKATVNDLTIFKTPDRTSLQLHSAASQGTSFKEGRLTIENVSASGGLLRTVSFKLKSVQVKFLSVEDGGAGQAVDIVELVFADMEMIDY